MNFAAIRISVGSVPPLLLGALRFLLPALPAIFLPPRPKIPWPLYLAYGMTISVGQFSFLFSAIHFGMTSGLASLVLPSQAFFTLLFAASWRPAAGPGPRPYFATVYGRGCCRAIQ